ncbi:hypothetical protein [Paenibacillus naphthalenovorans]|uniref:hypothetical protein n=1 Tax=Paenibacillus naphthalenovorans TaxID=162209 RepID=UPI003D28AEA2
MARIQKLTLANFKRQNVVEELTGKDIFIGPNGIGKSSRIQALGTALLGYVPGSPGKRPQDTFRVSTDEQMTVGLETDQFRFDRSFIRKTKTKRDGTREITVSQEVNVSPSRGESTLKEKESRIAEEMGNFPVMLDFGEFLKMSDAERRGFFYGLAGIDGEAWTKQSVSQVLVRDLLPLDLKTNNPDRYEAQQQVINEALAEWRTGMDAESGVKAMLEWAKAKEKHWNAEKRKATGAVQKLAELKNQLEETDRNINENRAELERLQGELNQVSAEIARLNEAKKAIDRRLARLAEIKQKVEAMEADNVPFDYASAEQQIKELLGQIVQVDASEQIDEIGKSIAAIEGEISAIETEMAEVQREAALAESKAKAMSQTVKQASERGGICVIASNIACPKDFTPFIGWAKEEEQKLLHEAANHKQHLILLTDKRKECRTRIANLQKARDQLYAESNQANKKNDQIRAQVRELEAQIEKARSAETLQRQRLADLKEERQRLEAEPADTVSGIEVLEKQLTGLQTNIAALKEKLQEQEKARTTISNMKASMIDSSTAENFYAASKYLAESLGPKGIQGEMLVNSLDPIREEVTANLTAMGFDHPFFFKTESDSGQEVFRFGWIDNKDREVDFDALSTGQQMIVLIALLVAILDRANPGCKVLAIDNIENLDKGNFQKVLKGLDVLCERLDNIILAGVIDVADIEGWTVHQLGKMPEGAIA